METQRVFPAGRIDLVLLANEQPIIAIENKVAARVGEGQLSRYGRWIREERRGSPISIVCLLTHLSSAPEGFVEGKAASGGAIPHVLKWGSIGTFFNELTKSETTSDDIRMLAGELFSFLAENGMSHEFAGRDDYAAALVYLRSGSRMGHTFNSIYTHVKSLGGCFGKGSSIHELDLYFDTDSKLIWGWTYLTHPTLDGLFFGYGISLDPNTTFQQGRIPSQDSLFLCVGAESNRSIQALRAAKSIPEPPWTYAEAKDWVTIISFRPLAKFMEEPLALASKAKTWIDENVTDINEFVSELR